jgi:class 3 adenylate cyclase
MPTATTSTHAELLLELLEQLSLGPATAPQAARRLRRRHRFTRLERRTQSGLGTLAEEGLVSTSAGQNGSPRNRQYRITQSGLATLERFGRFPAGAVVMFTDLVASTELIVRFGEAGAHERRQRHFELLRRAIAAHGGHEVKNLGDGLMVIFAEAADSVDCAAAMQRAVADDADRLGLRVGLHVGELLREEDDYFGTTVIVASRLCDAAKSGQILASAMLAEITGEDPKTTQRPIGAIELKGLGLPVESCELLWNEG